MHDFLLIMWIMKRIDESFLQKQITKGKITQDEYEVIIATPQVL